MYSKLHACDMTPLGTCQTLGGMCVSESDLNCNNVLKTTVLWHSSRARIMASGLHICKNHEGQPSACTQLFDDVIFVEDTQEKL